MKPEAAVKEELFDWAREGSKGELVRRTLEAKLGVRRRKRNRQMGAAVLLLVGLLWGVPWLRDTDQVTTASAARNTLTLQDGSTTELNARTELRTDFRYGRRVVTLGQGEAFFSVAPDPDRPFRVQVPGGTIEVTGTQFNVRVEEERAVVTLLEGSVSVRAGGMSTGLRPSEQLEVGSTARSLAESEMAAVVAWREGRIVLEGLTLGEAAQRFARYHGREIKVAPEVAGLLLGGSAPLDNLPGFVAFLQEAFPVSVLPQGEGYRVIAR